MRTTSLRTNHRTIASLAILLTLLASSKGFARQNIRSAFFDVYPQAVGSVLDTLPSIADHCGMCHLDFTGAGPRNAYGVRLEQILPSFPNNPQGRRDAIEFIEGEDPDLDAFLSIVEITDTTTYVNTPTFPGLTPLDLGNLTGVDIGDIETVLVPAQAIDIDPPEVEVITPNGGEILLANSPVTVEWTATDVSGIAIINLLVSDDGGATFRTVAPLLPNDGSYTWFPGNRPTTLAVFRVEAQDLAFNQGFDDSDGSFEIASPPGGLVATTLRDFDQPGSQPFEAGPLNHPSACTTCHGNYDAAVEPHFNWSGGMMAQASRDPLYQAAQTIANQDAPDSGDLCLRCHIPRAWFDGRSIPTDGSAVLTDDRVGVSCDLCHRLVDPIYESGENPLEDQAILAGLVSPPSVFANGMIVLDPTGTRRGPFEDADIGHVVLVSPFHREAALCGSCHDVSNPAFEDDGNGNYVPNTLDAAAAEFGSHALLPLERTYSEWFYSEYNTLAGVFAPQFGGNQDFVATCQDCHMRDVTGQGCFFGPVREDLPLHDMTGGSTWLPTLLPDLYPGDVDPAAVQAAVERARYMLQNAATLEVTQSGAELEVRVTNETGHKLPTGYPEGRRMWLNVRFLDVSATVLSESGLYDASTATLIEDPQLKIYEAKPGLDEDLAAAVGLPSGPSFHFVLNNKIFKDNRIPPRGFTLVDYETFGGAPVEADYQDGQHWDITTYVLPPGAASAEVTLYYQSTTREYVTFLRDENTTDGAGQAMFDLWQDNGRCPPEIMRSQTVPVCVAPCSDGDPCTITDACAGETCSGQPVDCSMAGDECNEAACDPLGTDGNCAMLSPINEGGACADGAGVCIGGVCQSTSCSNHGDCADLDRDGIRDDNCLYWECDSGICESTDVVFADMGGQFGNCGPDGAADGNDRFHALNCFANSDPGGGGEYLCEVAAPQAFNVDAGGQFGSCVPDGVCDGNDAFHALNAFDGSTMCSCPLDGGPKPDIEPRQVGFVAMSLAADRSTASAGDHIAIDVLLRAPLPDLRGYQLHLAVEGAAPGEIVPIDIRSCGVDRVFSGLEAWSAFNLETLQMITGLDTRGVAVNPGCLATFVFKIGDRARGRYSFELRTDPQDARARTYLFPSNPHDWLEALPVRPLTIAITPRHRSLRTGSPHVAKHAP